MHTTAATLGSRPATDRAVPAVAVTVVVVLLATAARYGYHRDELYFLAAGRHLSWGYADQGPLTPVLARLASAVDAGSLTVLRIPPALCAGSVVLFTGLLARDLDAGPAGQRIASGCAALSVFVLFTGHTLSTSTVDLLVWTVAGWLAVRALREDERWWLAVGAVLGLGLLNKPLPAFLGVAIVVGLVLAGPRRSLRSGYLWGGAVLALALGSPFLIWQAAHGWPQLTVSAHIAAGGSASSQPWWLVVPFQALLAGPLLAPVWIAGLVRLFRDPGVRVLRSLGWAWVVLAVVFMVTGGKPYYLAGLVPLLIAAGAAPTERWVARRRGRRRLLGAAVVVSAVVCPTLALPLLPARDAGPVVATNADVGETVGWPELVDTVAGVARTVPSPVILAENYGEAGAIDRYGPAAGLPHAYSGHNAYGYWGPPAAAADRPVVVIGYSTAQAGRWLADCRVAAHVHDAAGLDNDEDGAPVLVCAGVRGSWARQWPHIRRLG